MSRTRRRLVRLARRVRAVYSALDAAPAVAIERYGDVLERHAEPLEAADVLVELLAARLGSERFDEIHEGLSAVLYSDRPMAPHLAAFCERFGTALAEVL